VFRRGNGDATALQDLFCSRKVAIVNEIVKKKVKKHTW
jgi:hypothetical protein